MRSITILIAALIFLSHSTAFSQITNGAISGGMGNAGRAAVDPGESAFVNPASVAHLTTYYSAVHYDFVNHSTEGDGNRLGLLLADGSEGNIVSGAFSYVKKNMEQENSTWSGQDFQLTASGFVARPVAVGVSVHRWMSGAEDVNSNQDNVNLGFLITPSNSIGIGVVGYDLLNSDEAVPMIVRLKRTYALAGHILLMERFRFRLDLVHPETGNPGRRTEVMTGLESYFNEKFAFRLGGHWKETTDQMFVTTGIGFKGPRLSFDYSYQKDIRAGEGSRHMFDLWLPL